MMDPVRRTIEASYDGKIWWVTTWEWLDAAKYLRIRSTRPWDPDEEAMYSMDGKPISKSTKASESQPKIEPPLWEERDV